MSHRLPRDHFVVLIKNEGEYLLASRRIFSSREAAQGYARGIEFRDPIVIPTDVFLRLVDGWYHDPNPTVSGEGAA